MKTKLVLAMGILFFVLYELPLMVRMDLILFPFHAMANILLYNLYFPKRDLLRYVIVNMVLSLGLSIIFGAKLINLYLTEMLLVLFVFYFLNKSKIQSLLKSDGIKFLLFTLNGIYNSSVLLMVLQQYKRPDSPLALAHVLAIGLFTLCFDKLVLIIDTFFSERSPKKQINLNTLKQSFKEMSVAMIGVLVIDCLEACNPYIAMGKFSQKAAMLSIVMLQVNQIDKLP